MTAHLSVTGGAGGIMAHCDEMRALAGRFGGAAHDVLGATLSLNGYLVLPELASSAAFDPVGWARFEQTLLGALNSPCGLGAAGTRCGLIDGELRTAAAAYECVDRLDTALRARVMSVVDLPVAVEHGLQTSARTHDVWDTVQGELTTDPDLTDVVAGALYGGALTGDVSTGGMLTRQVLRHMPDGSAGERDLGVDHGGVAARPVRGLVDVIRDLDRRNEDDHDGSIDVRIITGSRGERHVIVDITGTKSFDPIAGSDVADLTSDARATLGASSSYERGVLAAMRRAGVRREDDVMLVGHSLGGAVAVTTARDALASGEFRVTHIVTAGGPIGQTVGQLPRSVQVLALENSHDIVPAADGTDNPDLPNVTTVRGVYGDGTVTGDHGLDSSYGPMAADVERSHDTSVRAFLGSARGFFRGDRVTTHVYQIVRRR